MNLKTTLLSAGAALILSAGAAAAAPAVTEAPVNLRAGPGTQYPVVDTIPGGATVDVGGCTGSWCQVNHAGETGYASRRYLAMAGGVAPSGAVAVAPGYGYDDPPLDAEDYYDYGNTYGLGFSFYVSPGHRFHHRGHRNRNWGGGQVGTWQSRPGWTDTRSGSVPSAASRSAIGGRASVTAPVGMPSGGGAGVFRGGAGAVGRAPAGGGAVFHGGAAAGGGRPSSAR